MTTESPESETLSFGPFKLSLQSGELYRDGSVVKLPPQPFKVLRVLVENAGQLVTRQELRDQIWGAETFVDFDKGLNLCIAQIREALGDDAQSPRYIETLPRRGYRFIAEIDYRPKEVEVANLRSPVSSKSAVIVGIGFALILVSIVAAVYFRPSVSAPIAATEGPKSMLLVLPFENLTDDPAQEYFSDGLTEEMITRLGSLQPERLGVIARTTALTYKKTAKDIRRIGDELGVDYVLEGSVRRDGTRLRITSQLIKVNDQTHLWAETYDRDEKDVLDIQREVATRIASSLRLELLPGSPSGTAAGKAARPEAYDAYLKGRFLITKDTVEDLRRSIPYFDQAIADDPTFAPAYAAQVEALVLLTAWTGDPRSSELPKAKAAASKALELDPSYGDAYAAMASVQFWLEWKRGEAEANFQRALELNPYNPLTRINYSQCLFARGDIDGGVQELNEAVRLDPVSLLTTGLASSYQLGIGRYDEAITLANRMLELEPTSPAAHSFLFRANVAKGNYPEALQVMRNRMSQQGAKTEEINAMDQGAAKQVFESQSRKTLDEMRRSESSIEGFGLRHAAWLAVNLGENEEALKWLERALEARAPFMLNVGIDPTWGPLRSHPKFEEIRQAVASAST